MKSTGPNSAENAAPGLATPEKTPKPDKTAAPSEARPDDTQTTLSPGQARPGGTDKGPASRPSGDPAIPERKGGPRKNGET